MIVEKTYLADEKAFKQHQAKYWKNDSYTRYSIGKPAQFPCVAIEQSESDGDLGTYIIIENFVYLTDFKDLADYKG